MSEQGKSNMNYQEALDYLVHLTTFGFNFGLGRIEHLLAQLGNPEKKIKTLHIGGTNGKGSVSAMVVSILREAGYKVGAFNSPHLHSYRERVTINGEWISRGRVADLLNRLRPILEQMVADGFEHPTEFEVNTALALLYFYEEQVDIAVLEVGLGGLIDSTNVIDPLVAVITNVGMDHMNYLGNTIEEIAKIKAGIIKDKSIVVTAASRPEALQEIEAASREKEATLIKVGDCYRWTSTKASTEGQLFDLYGQKKTYHGLGLRLLGDHQLVNAATAVAVVEALQTYHGLAISEDAIRQGLQKTTWPGRLELVRPGLLLDGAHNLDGAVTLAKALHDIFSYRKLVLCIGMLADKERGKVLAELAPLADKIVVTKPNNPRAGNWQEMANEARKYVSEVHLEENIETAVDLAISLAEEGDLVCVTGSLYMISAARAHLLNIQAD